MGLSADTVSVVGMYGKMNCHIYMDSQKVLVYRLSQEIGAIHQERIERSL
jgi:hypothetical protein